MVPDACCPERAPEINILLDTLRHHVRREIIYYFEHCNTAKTAMLDEVVAYIHNQAPDTSRKQLEIVLVHNHLPKLADCDWIEYDTRSREIQYYGHETAAHLLGEVHAMFDANSAST